MVGITPNPANVSIRRLQRMPSRFMVASKVAPCSMSLRAIACPPNAELVESWWASSRRYEQFLRKHGGHSVSTSTNHEVIPPAKDEGQKSPKTTFPGRLPTFSASCSCHRPNWQTAASFYKDSARMMPSTYHKEAFSTLLSSCDD